MPNSIYTRFQKLIKIWFRDINLCRNYEHPQKRECIMTEEGHTKELKSSGDAPL